MDQSKKTHLHRSQCSSAEWNGVVYHGPFPLPQNHESLSESTMQPKYRLVMNGDELQLEIIRFGKSVYWQMSWSSSIPVDNINLYFFIIILHSLHLLSYT